MAVSPVSLWPEALVTLASTVPRSKRSAVQALALLPLRAHKLHSRSGFRAGDGAGIECVAVSQ